ncbi:MAG TPA: DUF488 domain-containing protein [Gemmatimonadaceae bacterium]|nr:DUF488 domain-containing protein [Gemmatimonadaceae bacterium]
MSGDAPVTVYSIGHSTRTWDAFAALLRREEISHLVDVRAFPASRRHPHFNRDALARALAAVGVGYTHAPELGGRRRRPADAPANHWRNDAFAAYADYMRTGPFRAALATLRRRAAAEATVIMCAEVVPWRCHRMLVSDALVARGDRVLHILDAVTEPHSLTSFARIVAGEPRYDADTQAELGLERPGP